MPATFNLILHQQVQNDMMAVLHYYSWLLHKQGASLEKQREVLDQILKVERAAVGSEFSSSKDEFGNLYSAAQYLLRDMMGTAGDGYFKEMIGYRKTKEWQVNYRKHLIDTSMILINECNNKFEKIPEFAQLKNKIDKEFKNR